MNTVGLFYLYWDYWDYFILLYKRPDLDDKVRLTNFNYISTVVFVTPNS